ncbi:MAG: exodeoxyribonuclease VII small subunit [Clostridia bacterium]|nr:exodeoxyribonuclease VII small subunit [Clostridia bacterium]
MYDIAQYEPSIAKLEEIVKQLEAGELSLSDSMDLFEQGMKASKECYEILKNAEQKLKILSEEDEEE